jgi:hypothetical protein
MATFYIDTDWRILVTAGDWNKIVKGEFDARMNEMAPEDRNDQEAIQTHFADVVEWHLKAMTTELNHLKTTGKLVLPVAKYIRTLTTLVSRGLLRPTSLA